MRWLTLGVLVLTLSAPTPAQRGNAPAVNDPIRGLVSQLTLDNYKATIKGLTQFGDRRAGTDRNRAAIDWIEAQLKSYGCTNTERLKYEYPLAGTRNTGAGGGRVRGTRVRTGVNNDPNAQPEFSTRCGWSARRGLLYEDRQHTSRRNVHRLRAHGRHRLG